MIKSGNGEQMKIIAIDSSGLVASVAILEDDTLIAEYNVQYQKTHSQTLLPMLDELRRMVSLDISTVDAIAVSKGPGSFTGLRIGSATAKGLAQAINVPIIEVSTLEGMASNMYGTSSLICPIMDAKRGQVYAGLYLYQKKDKDIILENFLPDCAIAVEDMLPCLLKASKELERDVVFLGDGVPVFKEKIEEFGELDCWFAPAHMNRQRAASFGKLAIEKLKKGETVSFFDHEPDYLRLSQAERERNEGIRNKGSNY